MTLSIHRRADLWGDRTAVVDHTDGETVSYADLADRADGAAGRLAARGVGAGDAVCVLAYNRPALLALFFGARRLGATLAPVSHRLAPGTVADVVDRIDPGLVIYQAGFTAGVADLDATRCTLEELHDGERADVDPDPGANPPLYLHTGGTTGAPKVVVIGERQLEWNAITEIAAWGIGEDAVSPVLLPMFHTGGWTLLTLPTLYAGGTVVTLREFDPDEAIDAIETHGATRVFGVAAIFQAIAAADRFTEADFSTVKWFMSGGGPTPESVFEAYRERGHTFVQGYGLTEGGPNDLYFPPDRDEVKPDSVGRPFPDVEVRIVDDGDPVPRGDVGELELAGPVTADRYLATEDGTFDGEWVSTGDLVWVDADGDYYIVGRTDNMFTSGGENVYPEAVERTLEQHEGVEAAGVVGIPHNRWGTAPKAVVVGDVPVESLDAYARDRLADFQVPVEWERAEALPTSGPGKLDRDALERRYGA